LAADWRLVKKNYGKLYEAAETGTQKKNLKATLETRKSAGL